MAVTAELEEVKVMLKFTKGSQTIPHCNKEATDANLHSLAVAIASLNQETLERIMKVTETKLLG
ncbi:MAG: hypothetical protein RR090_12005 [Niameybacter sp.]|uniref:DUF1659 domain-containing protein n=1 Tax=Niameybacter sp. TaxID=2033640 RepID=UPI002FC7CFF1